MKQESFAGEGTLQFGAFEFELESGELRRDGAPVKLQPQPARVLALLASRAGQVVSREEIREFIWGGETFVDYEHGLNYCIRQIRLALEDSAQTPAYLETVPRRGYRFIAAAKRTPPREETAMLAQTPRLGTGGRRRMARRAAATLILGVLAIAALSVLKVNSESGVAAQRTVVAVLPFDDAGPVPHDEFLSLGLTEVLISRLGQVAPTRLAVAARTSVEHYWREGLSPAEIARHFGADYVVEGTLRRNQNRIWLSVRLIRTDDETQAWAYSQERLIDDVLDFQADVSDRIAAQIPSVIDQAALGVVRPRDPQASLAYLKARYLSGGFRFSDAIEQFRICLDREPRFGPAWSGMAYATSQLYFYQIKPDPAIWDETRQAAQQALQWTPQSSEALTALALVDFYGCWDHEMAERRFRKALEVNPSDVSARLWYASLLNAQGEQQRALDELSLAHQLDPMSVLISADAAWYYYYAGRYREAASQARQTLDISQNAPWARLALFWSCYRLGEEEETRRQALALAELWEFPAEELERIGAGEPQEGIRVWMHSVQRFSHSYQRVLVSAALGDEESLKSDLQEAVERRAWQLVNLEIDPLLERYRSRPWFQELLARVRPAGAAPR